jgi:hypothetical protein
VSHFSVQLFYFQVFRYNTIILSHCSPIILISVANIAPFSWLKVVLRLGLSPSSRPNRVGFITWRRGQNQPLKRRGFILVHWMTDRQTVLLLLLILIYSLQKKTAVLVTSHIIRNVLQSETWSQSGGVHHWFKRKCTRKNLQKFNSIL